MSVQCSYLSFFILRHHNIWSHVPSVALVQAYHNTKKHTIISTQWNSPPTLDKQTLSQHNGDELKPGVSPWNTFLPWRGRRRSGGAGRGDVLCFSVLAGLGPDQEPIHPRIPHINIRFWPWPCRQPPTRVLKHTIPLKHHLNIPGPRNACYVLFSPDQYRHKCL